MEFSFYNVTSIHGFTSMLPVVCTKTIMLWVFTTASKIAYIRIIRFILTTDMNKQYPWKRVRVDEDSALENSTYVTNLLVDKFKISTETTGGNASRINGNNEGHNRSIHNIVRSGLLDSYQNEKKMVSCSRKINRGSYLQNTQFSRKYLTSLCMVWYVERCNWNHGNIQIVLTSTKNVDNRIPVQYQLNCRESWLIRTTVNIGKSPSLNILL